MRILRRKKRVDNPLAPREQPAAFLRRRFRRLFAKLRKNLTSDANSNRHVAEVNTRTAREVRRCARSAYSSKDLTSARKKRGRDVSYRRRYALAAWWRRNVGTSRSSAATS
jgi:hypothetical protein